jgi:lipopolysaccharide export system permease protein
MVTSMFYSMATQNLLVGLKERVFFESLPGFVLYAENIVHEENKIKGVIIADQGVPEAPIYYFAEEGLVRGNPKEGNISLLLKNGTIHRADNSEGVYQLARFGTYWVKFDLAQMLMPHTVRKPAMEEFTLPELREEIREQQAEGKDVRKLRLNYQQRLALPFGALVFCALGVPLALLSQQAVRYTGFSLSIGVVLLYYILMQAGSGLTFAGRIPALLGAWLPNLALGTLGVYLMWRKAEEKPVRILEAYAQLVQDLQTAIRRRLQGRS